MNTKKVLLLNGSYSEIPLIKAIQDLGYSVVVLGNNEQAPGNKLADRYVKCDYSNREAVLKIAQNEGICAIVSCCHDFGIRTAAWIGEQLGLKGHDDIEKIEMLHLKDKYRELAKKLGVKTPKVIKCNNTDVNKIINNISFPLIIKAVDLTTGHGMTKCTTKDELEPALKLALSKTRLDYVIAEEFIEGTNHGFSTFLQNGKIVFYFVDNEQHNINQYLVSGASTTTKVPQSAIKQLITDCEKIAKDLNLVDGIFHIQFILDKNNQPTILEVTRRAPGDLYIKLVQFATGINYPELIVKAEMGLPLGEIKQIYPKYHIVRHCIMSNNKGVIKDVEIDENIKEKVKVKDSFTCWKEGDVIEDEKLYKAGILFIYFDTEEEMDSTIPKLNSLISIVTT